MKPRPNQNRVLAVVSVFLLLGGYILQHVVTADKYPPPGELVLVAGHRLHLLCMGSGDPTVVLEPGADEFSLTWYQVQPEVAKFARVCAVDRAGTGWSEPESGPRRAKEIAEEIRAQLRSAGIRPPYVLVGHSFGGFTVRLHAALHPEEVAGVVLVDAEHENVFTNYFPEEKAHFRHTQLKLLLGSVSSSVDIPQALGWCGEGPARIRAELQAISCRFRSLYTAYLERAAWEDTVEQVRHAGTLGMVPLAVVSSDPQRNGLGMRWDRAQQTFLQLSGISFQLVAPGSGHLIQYDRPDVVVDAIRRILRNEYSLKKLEPPPDEHRGG